MDNFPLATRKLERQKEACYTLKEHLAGGFSCYSK